VGWGSGVDEVYFGIRWEAMKNGRRNYIARIRENGPSVQARKKD